MLLTRNEGASVVEAAEAVVTMAAVVATDLEVVTSISEVSGGLTLKPVKSAGMGVIHMRTVTNTRERTSADGTSVIILCFINLQWPG